MDIKVNSLKLLVGLSFYAKNSEDFGHWLRFWAISMFFSITG